MLQPARLRDPEWPARLAALAADVAVVAAFGQILPQAVLDVPARGSINVHASLLPRYRGRGARSPGRSSAARRRPGSRRSRWTRAWTRATCCSARPTPIGPDETAGELAARLAEIGARGACCERSTSSTRARSSPSRRTARLATLAPRLKKEDGWLRLEEPARALANRVRGINPLARAPP